MEHVLDEKRRMQKGRWSSLVFGIILLVAGLVGMSQVLKIKGGYLDAVGTLALVVLGTTFLNHALLGFHTNTEKELLWKLCEREMDEIGGEANQAPEPTPTAVTPPAGQEARQP